MSHHLPMLATAHDPLTRMRVYQLASELMPDAYKDARTLAEDPLMIEVARQLYAAVCSIEGNVAEGYSRSSGKDRALRFEYALGSVRESMTWYKSASPVLGKQTSDERSARLEEMRRLLLAIIPRERRKTMR